MTWQEKLTALQNAGIGIYDDLPSDQYFLTANELECALNAGLRNLSLAGLPLRTRSKVLKTAVCDALHMSPPRSFKKCQPRFPNQDFDTYAQKSTNLQIWNEEIDPNRKYAIIQLDSNDVVVTVKVIMGRDLVLLDNTGTLTQKYQARITPPLSYAETFSDQDIIPVAGNAVSLNGTTPLDNPQRNSLMPISMLASKLSASIGMSFPYQGADQERNRGGSLHALVCRLLGYSSYADDGQFPDIKHQLLEIKLQTSPTIDLGLYSPADSAPTGISVDGRIVLHNEVRHAVFSASTVGDMAQITGVAIGYGRDFYNRFPQFQGNVVNRKLQIPLPADFFD